MKSYIPKYTFKFPNNLPSGDIYRSYPNRQILTCEIVYSMHTCGTYTLNDIKTLLIDGKTIGGRSIYEHNQIFNKIEACDYVFKLAYKKTDDYKITKEVLCSLNGIFAKDTDIGIGRFRNCNLLRSYKCINNHELDTVFKNDINIISNIKNPLEHALILKLWISYCSFFTYGSNNTAILASNIILLSNNLGVMYIPSEYKKEYDSLMIQFCNTLEADNIIKFLLEKCITFFDGLNYKTYKELFDI
ncbi:Fic/Doc-related protein [[Clostridium] sordellii]|uniref:hypothetical protein n=1 Tax=Paraclostridium sordellii TaxID=1505 RepID=UPI00054346F3|nr:hypothetical protein [Paeniclostridium sordellii]CEK34613.1 Fic/Doc-related protein [[Clostridium] sordellii] [Paeniclostridium sordellii]